MKFFLRQIFFMGVFFYGGALFSASVEVGHRNDIDSLFPESLLGKTTGPLVKPIIWYPINTFKLQLQQLFFCKNIPLGSLYIDAATALTAEAEMDEMNQGFVCIVRVLAALNLYQKIYEEE